MALPDAPDLTAEIAFSSNPGSTPVWDNVSEYALAWSTRRGRQHELDRPDAGEGSSLFHNWDRRFEPENAAGPYSPNVIPMRRIRFRGTWEGVTQDVLHGFIQSIAPIYDEGGFNEVIQVKFADAFKVLALAKVTASYSQQLSGARVNAVLDSIGWPAADRDVDSGISTIPASTLDDVPALTHLIDVATAELGFFYASRDGKVRFIDRHQAFLAPEEYATHTWGDSGAEYAYSDIALDFDDSNLWNEVKVTRVGGIEQVVSDSASATKYGTGPTNFRTLQRSGVLLATDNEALDQANYLLSRYKEVATRASSMTLAPQLDTTQWPHVLHHDIGDKVRIRRRPLEGGLIEQEVYIQGISHDWSAPGDAGPGTWTVRWDLSPVGGLQFWILDDPVRSVLDSTTRLGV